MQEGPQSPPGFVASVGFFIGRCLRRLAERVRQLGRSARTGYQVAANTDKRPVWLPTTPVRAFGSFLVGFQAIALMLMVIQTATTVR
jgi:hypothetical protein